MIDFEALFKLSYGLYIVCSGNNQKANGYIANTFFQVTAEPPQFATCCHKNNYSSEFIQQFKCFSVSILEQEATPDIIGRFGYRSGRTFDKLSGLDLEFGITGCPIVLNDSMAVLECKLVQTIDLGTHFMFVGELIQSRLLDESKDALTYDHYRKVRKGMSPQNAPTYIEKGKLKPKIANKTKYECSVCGYVYDEELGDPVHDIKAGTKFKDIAEDWVCPVCGAGKEDFIPKE